MVAYWLSVLPSDLLRVKENDCSCSWYVLAFHTQSISAVCEASLPLAKNALCLPASTQHMQYNKQYNGGHTGDTFTRESLTLQYLCLHLGIWSLNIAVYIQAEWVKVQWVPLSIIFCYLCETYIQNTYGIYHT